MQEFSLKESLNAACDIIDSKEKFGGIYRTYSHILNISGINFKDMTKQISKPWGNFLCISGTGEPCLNAILFGSKHASIFDINALNFPYLYLEIAGVISLEYEEYISYFYYTQDNKFLDSFYFKKIMHSVSTSNLNFWQELYKKYSVEELRRLMTIDFSLPNTEFHSRFISVGNNPFLTKENFYILKQKLQQRISLNCYIETFENMPNILNQNEYDQIYLANSHNFALKPNQEREYFEKLKQYAAMLRQNGYMIATEIYDDDNAYSPSYYDNNLIPKFIQNGYYSFKVPLYNMDDKENLSENYKRYLEKQQMRILMKRG